MIFHFCRSWTMCHGLSYGGASISGVEIFKDFNDQDQYGKKYCDNWIRNHALDLSHCTVDNSILDCSNNPPEAFDVQGLGCHLSTMDHDYDKIMTDFPLDQISIDVDDFGKGETSSFFKDFNGVNSDLNLQRSSLTFYGTKFDLSSLEFNTNPNITKDVIVKADTVIMSRPLKINYELKIIARLAKIDQPITMEMSVADFIASGKLRTSYEKRVFFGESDSTMVRHRQYGLVDIIDVEQTDQSRQVEVGCLPTSFKSKEVDTEGWFDQTLVNLMYVCALTVLPSNTRLSSDVANFSLDFHHDKEVVNDLKTFVTAQKFKRVQEQSQNIQAHNIPAYGLGTIKELAEVLYEYLHLYYESENNQQIQMAIAMQSMKDMGVQFQIIEQQQEYYFEQELSVLEQIFAATDTSWDYSFAHRNATENSINGAIGATGDMISKMQEEQMKTMLEEAKNSVGHFTDAKNKFQAEVERYDKKVQSDVTVIKDYNVKFNEAKETLDQEKKRFEINVAKYEAQQAASWFSNFLNALKSLVTGIITENWGAIMDAIADIAKLIIELKDLIEEILDIIDMIMSISGAGFDDLTSNPSTDFTTAIKKAVEMKLAAPKFDQLNSIADHKLKDFDRETDYKIDGLEDLIMAVQGMSDIGNRLVGECSSFADDIMNWMDRKGDLALAEQDLQRAEDQVKNIE